MDFAYEILIGDDGSDDGSLELLQRKYGEKEQIRILVHANDCCRQMNIDHVLLPLVFPAGIWNACIKFRFTVNQPVHISAFKPRRNNVVTLYERKKTADVIDYEMWNGSRGLRHTTFEHRPYRRHQKAGAPLQVF